LLFSCHADQKDASPITEAVVILYNAAPIDTAFKLPEGLPPEWKVLFYSGSETPGSSSGTCWRLSAQSILLAISDPLRILPG
jgi:hypothetical protein